MTKEFEEFADRVTDKLIDRLREDGHEHITVGVGTVGTDAGSYEAVSVKMTGSDVVVRTNLSKAYEAYQNGTPLDVIAQNMAHQIGDSLDQLFSVSLNSITDYEQVKDRLMIDLVPANQNLDGIPHGKMADLPFVCKAMLGTGSLSKGTVLINNALLEQYGITSEQLFRDALENVPRTRPASITGMSMMLDKDLFGEEFLFVASSPDGIHGAGVIAYPGFLDQAAQQLDGDFYVLPSSIHEVILVKDDGGFRAAEMSALVREVNQTELKPEDRLSDHAYHFDSREHIFERAEQFEARQNETRSKKSLLGNLAEKTQRVSEEKEHKSEHAHVPKEKGGEAI